MSDNKLFTNPLDDKQRLLRPEEAAELLCISIRTLEAWRQRGGGPKYLRYSKRCVRYQVSDLQDWKEGRIRRNTSEG